MRILKAVFTLTLVMGLAGPSLIATANVRVASSSIRLSVPARAS